MKSVTIKFSIRLSAAWFFLVKLTRNDIPLVSKLVPGLAPGAREVPSFVYHLDNHEIEFARVVPDEADQSEQSLWRAIIRLDKKVSFLSDHIEGESVYKIIRAVFAHYNLYDGTIYIFCLAKTHAFDNQLSEIILRFPCFEKLIF